MFSMPSKTRRFHSAFATSALLHAGAFSFLALSPWPGDTAPQQPPREHKYAVLLLRLQDLPPHIKPQQQTQSGSRRSASGMTAGAASSVGASAGERQTPAGEPADTNPSPEAADSSIARLEYTRPFVLPPVSRRDPVPQTLIEPDVPPEIRLKHEIPLPALQVWERLTAIHKNFVAPVVKRATVAPVVPEAPELSAVPIQPNSIDPKLAATTRSQMALLIKPPAQPPVARNTPVQPANEPPQLVVSEVNSANLTNLISMPQSPVISAITIAIPPANQVAAPGGAGSDGKTENNSASNAGRPGNGASSGARSTTTGSGPGGSGNAAATRALASDGAPSASGLGSGAEAGNGGRGLATAPGGSGFSGKSIAGLGAAGASLPGTMSAGVTGGLGTTSAAGGADDISLSGVTRLTLPKDGKFGITVAGSSLAAPYAESIGALSGKIVYSVFVGVGLPKKWILEYCLPRSEEQKNVVKGRALPVEAPYPYVIVRPDELGTSNRDYVIVHGLVTPEGRVDQLSMIFPTDFTRKEMLMSSLKQWTFRPASRDGVPAEVEFLMIIPGQPE